MKIALDLMERFVGLITAKKLLAFLVTLRGRSVHEKILYSWFIAICKQQAAVVLLVVTEPSEVGAEGWCPTTEFGPPKLPPKFLTVIRRQAKISSSSLHPP